MQHKRCSMLVLILLVLGACTSAAPEPSPLAVDAAAAHEPDGGPLTRDQAVDLKDSRATEQGDLPSIDSTNPDLGPDLPAGGQLTLMVISDVHLDGTPKPEGWLKDVIQQVNANSAVQRLVVTGDVVSYIYPDATDTSVNLLDRATALLQQLSVPYHLVMGNHEYKLTPESKDPTFGPAEAIWKQSLGLQPYYAVTVQGWKLVMLNSMDGRPKGKAYDDAQLAWLTAELAAGKPTLLFTHYPLKTDGLKYWCKKGLVTPEEDPGFFALLQQHKDQIKGIFVGHGHRFVKDILHGTIPVYETGGLGENTFFCGPHNHHVVTLHHTTQSISVTKGSLIPYL